MQRDTLAFRTVLAAARQRNGLDEARCHLVLEFLSTAAAANAALHRQLADLGLSELKFAVLVVLFALDPAPATPADLAIHTSVTRSAITDALDGLEARDLLVRQRDTHDRRLIYVQLTDAGRASADAALTRFLQAAGQLARYVPPANQNALLHACAQLHEGAARLSAAPDSSSST